MTEEKLQVAQEHIESLEQQLADAEKKTYDANQKGIYFLATSPALEVYTTLLKRIFY